MKKETKTNILIITFLIALAIVILTKAYERPFQGEEKSKGNEWIEERQKMPTDEQVRKMMVELEQEELKHAVIKPQPTKDSVKVASWYDYSLEGIEWSINHRTAASRDLIRYETYRVTNIANGKHVDVFINDYIEHPDRDIDLSSYAFNQIADLKLGLINVKIEKL